MGIGEYIMLTDKEYEDVLNIFCRDLLNKYKEKFIDSMSKSTLEEYLNYPDSDRIIVDIKVTYLVKEIKDICKNKKYNFINKFFRRKK